MANSLKEMVLMADEAQEVKEVPLTEIRREQKIGFVLLLIFALLSIALGFVQIRNTLYKPFALNSTIPKIYQDTVNTVDALRYRDTDGDGLSDYDELYAYHTSPYLADTDSDGIQDKEEVDKGTDPLCPKDKSCSAGDSDLVGTPNVTSSFEQLNPGEKPDFTKLLSDPAQIRAILIQGGMTQAEVDKLSDKDLVSLTEQFLQTTSATLNNIPALKETIKR